MAKAAKKDPALTPEEKLAQALIPESEQPYQIPENWCWVILRSISFHISDGSHNPPKDSGEGVPLLSATNIHDRIIDFEQTARWITNEEWMLENERTRIEAGDILLTIVATIGRVAVVTTEQPFALQRSVATIKPKINAQYLSYYFESPYVQTFMNTNAKGTAQKGFYLNSLENLFCAIPPLAEQQRIVDRVESLFAKLDEAKEKARAVVDSFEDRKAAILHKAFTGELTAEWRNTHGVSIADWENAPLETVFQLRSGSTIDVCEELECGAIPYVKVADMNLPENEIQITTSSRFVDECPVSHVIPKGSTIFPKRGGAILTNKKRYVGVEKIIADLNTMAIMPIAGRAYGWYGYYWMQSVDLRQLNNGSNVPQINNKDMVKLFVPTPSIDEQKAIVGILDGVFDKEIEAKETAEQVIDQIDSMKKSILARAFRGELGTNDPADESAEQLLKRIL